MCVRLGHVIFCEHPFANLYVFSGGFIKDPIKGPQLQYLANESHVLIQILSHVIFGSY